MLEVVLETPEREIERDRVDRGEADQTEKILNGAVKVFAEILSLLEIQPQEEQQRVQQYAKALSDVLQVPERWESEAATALCHIGYLTLPPAILQKLHLQLSLNSVEKAIFESVPEIGSRLLSKIPGLEGVAQIVRYHKKNFDGTGLPDESIAGEKIPLVSRILKVATDLAKLESDGFSKKAGLDQMRHRAVEYDPNILDGAVQTLCINANAKLHRGRAVPVAELKIGNVLIESVFTNDGLKVVGAGTAVTPFLLEKLKNFAQLGSVSEQVLVH